MIERGQGGKMLEIGNVTRALRVLLLTLDNRGIIVHLRKNQ